MPRALVPTVTFAVAVAVLGSCDKGSREERFCKQLAAVQDELSVVPQDPADLDQFVGRYRKLARVAPLAIDEQWATITELVEAVALADVTNPLTADRLRDQAVAATKAVDDVRSYARSTCGVDLVLGTTTGAVTPTTGAPTTTPGAPPPTTSTGTIPPTVP